MPLNTDKNKSILVQTVLITALLFFAFAAANGFAIYDNGSDFYMSEVMENKKRLTGYVENIMSSYDCISWLLDYWLENYELIDISRNYEDLDFNSKYQQLPNGILINRKSVKKEIIEELLPEHQLLFAEYCYRELMADLDDIKTMLKPVILYCIRPLDDNRAFVFFNAIDKNQNKNQEFIKEQLGTIWPLDMSKHPVINEMYQEAKELDEFEHVKLKNQEILYGYMPVIIDGKIICHITAAFILDNVKDAIYKSVIAVEIKNALYLACAGIILTVLLYKTILQPLSKVQSSVREYTRRKDTSSIVDELEKIKSKNEIGRLADDISLLAVSLEQQAERSAHFKSEKARIDTELSLAAAIQEGVLPKDFPAVKEFSLSASMNPAKEVGGDFYDFFMIDENRIALVIGDVSGKGISAALFMMTAKSVLKECALSEHGSIQDIINKVNDKLYEGNEAMLFVTLWFGIMTVSTGEIVYINAGHEFPALRRNGENFKIINDIHARPLAILKNIAFCSGKLKLNHGDTLFLYTDGATDAHNKLDEQFGETGLINALNENPYENPDILQKNVLQKINDFTLHLPQFDDISFLCIKYH